VAIGRSPVAIAVRRDVDCPSLHDGRMQHSHCDTIRMNVSLCTFTNPWYTTFGRAKARENACMNSGSSAAQT
jgi:hypothetical protein